ncbi:MAG: hypothetical protein K9L32_00555 [Chromatiaceae bacterium]|nr:hypothetical protein [Chromatiaceae bacterium]MCF8002695.1 hypothetical protein [Chromatiaceae bacterium]
MKSRRAFLKSSIAYAIALAGPVLSIPAKALSMADQAYINSAYGYCDAKKVAFVWGRNAGEAKTIIGNKILANLQNLIDQDIQSTRGRVFCTYQETDLSYSDAENLGRYWGRPTHEAKEKATQMVSEMGTKRFREIMAGALRGY